MTFAIHTPGNDQEDLQDELDDQGLSSLGEEEVIQDKDISTLRKQIKDVYQDLRQIATEAKMSYKRQAVVNEGVESNNSYNFYMTLIETVAFIAICGGQIYYVKHLLENKRII